MKCAQMLGLGILAAVLVATGCDKKADSPKAEEKKGKESGTKEGEHAHGKGPNGGVVFDLGKHHAEFTVDHDKKECTVLLLSPDEKDPKVMAVVAMEFTLTTKPTKTKDGKVVSAMTIVMVAKDQKDGKASKFVGSDPGLGNVAEFEGTVNGEIDGKPSSGEFKE